MTGEDAMIKLKEQVTDIQICLAKLSTEFKHTNRMIEDRKEHGAMIEEKLENMSKELKDHVSKTNELLGSIASKINFAAGAVAVITAAASYVIQHILAKFKGTA